MKQFRADLHIHTVLSPCADLEMTPANIVKKAKSAGLQIIGITDHNSTKNAKIVKRLAEKEGIFTLTGVEITTKEDVHCLAFFEHSEELDSFQIFLDKYSAKIPNVDGEFGYQPVLDENENIIELVDFYLPAAIKKSIDEVENEVTKRNGLFIPAHVNRMLNGIFGQLGFIPPGVRFDALGISNHISENDARKHYVLENKISLLRNSDAHFLDQIGTAFSTFFIEKPSFMEIKLALNQEYNRMITCDDNNR